MSIRTYEAYRPSDLPWIEGQIPSHWHSRKVRWLFDIRKRIAGDVGFDVFSITQAGIRVKDLESNEGQLSDDYSKYQLVEPGDFAMNHMDLITGGVDIAKSRGVTSPDYRVVSLARPDSANPRYFLYAFQKCFRERIFYAYGQGSSQLGRWRLPTDNFRDFLLPVPPLEEQIAISSFLDVEVPRIDALIAEQERLIELLNEKRQAVISHAVTKGLNPDAPMKPSGVEWLGDLPRHWTTAQLSQLARQIVDGAHLTPTYVESGVPFLRVTDIGGDVVALDEVKRIPPAEHEELTQRCRPERGDLLLSKNGTIGMTKIVDWDWEFSIFVSLCLIKPASELDVRFAGYAFRSSAIRVQMDDASKQNTVTNLHLEKIRNLKFPIPPLDEQRAIAAYLDSQLAGWTALLSESTRMVDLLGERRVALISAAVTGQIDVRGQVREEALA